MIVIEGEAAYQIAFRNNMRDQTEEMNDNIRHAATLKIPKIIIGCMKLGTCVIVAGAPSVKQYLEEIRKLRSDPNNIIFAVNWAHNWLIKNQIIPDGCLMYEIDVDPTEVLTAPHPDVTYYICSLCHPTTFDGLQGFKRVLWHAAVDPVKTQKALHECFPGEMMIGGGQTTFSRTIPLGLVLGYRNFEVFGADSSFPDEAVSTHVDGYPTNTKVEDSVEVWAYNKNTQAKRKFKTLPYLALQAHHFYGFCHRYHRQFNLRIHGDGLLRFMHETDFPEQYK